MKILKVKASDIVSFVHEGQLHYGEIGPGKRYTTPDLVHFEVYPIHETGPYFEYADDPVWVNYQDIATHQSVRNRKDFHNAWIALAFNPIVTDDHVCFEKMFDTECQISEKAFASLDHLYTSDDDDMSLRSIDSYSTVESLFSDDSFLVQSDVEEFEEHEPECDCEYCTVTRESVKWFDRDWKPKDLTENKVRSFIEYLENKYIN